MSWRCAILALGAILALASAVAGRQERPFPHDLHQGLFPVCSGCHAGVEAGDPSEFYPAAARCAGCHDGQLRSAVSWTAPASRITNVAFDHVEHVADLEAFGDPAASCESCHSDPAAGRMSVDANEELDTCWGCHAHERGAHFEPVSAEEVPAGTCEACHVPLANSGFDRPRLEGLPRPANHEGRDFVLEGHAVAVTEDPGRCATCHTADRCAACHVDAGLTEIGLIPSAPAEMDQPSWGSAYPAPESHGAAAWDMTHAPTRGRSVDAAAECSTCHTSTDCLSCHIEPAPDVVGELPTRGSVHAPGVVLDVRAPQTHDSYFFMSAHSNLAAADPATCATCHTETYCVDCHDGPGDGGYHPSSFVARHVAAAYGRAEGCATCHSTAAFCRECHEQSGFGSQGRLGAGYHDAEPIWLLRHGGAARQSLESCASCHQQSDCVQCHGVLGAFGVSPHTPEFDAVAAWARSPRICIACHTSNPVGGVGAPGGS